MRLRGLLWLRFLWFLALVRLYVIVRAFLIRHRIDAELLVECGDHDGRLRFRDLPSPDGTRPGTLDD